MVASESVVEVESASESASESVSQSASESASDSVSESLSSLSDSYPSTSSKAKSLKKYYLGLMDKIIPV